MIRKKILIATGGTGGHVFPAYALANYLKGKNYDLQLTTDSRGYFYLKEHKSLNLVKLPSSPLEKKNLFKLLFSFLVIMFSIIRSLLFLLNNRPSIIFGMGGYSSFPICIAASILRIKFIIYENNLIIGKANKYLLPFAKKILVSHKDTYVFIDVPNNNFDKKFFSRPYDSPRLIFFTKKKCRKNLQYL